MATHDEGADSPIDGTAIDSTVIDSTVIRVPESEGDSVIRRPGMFYLFGRVVLSTIARTLYRPKVVGRKNIPKAGAVILASNHLAFIDSIVIPITAPRRVQFLAKSHYFEGHGIKGRIQKAFFTSIGAVGVSRGAGQAAQEALDQSKRILDTGSAFAVYPEGTRSQDGRLYKGRTGVAWLALTTGAPVVPVGLIGTDQLQPAGRIMPRFRKVTVVFGEPIDVSTYGVASSGRARRLATDQIMAAIQQCSGQVAAGVYNEVPPSGRVERIRRAVMHTERM